MTSARALLLALLAALPAGAVGDVYRCECCSAHFGRNPEAPSYWGKGLGYGRLMQNRSYDEVVSRFDYAYRKGDYSLQDVAWVSQALFALGALQSGLPDPLKPMLFYQEKKPEDVIGRDLAVIRESWGKRIWQQAAIEKYGAAALCTIDETYKADPKFPWAFKKRVSVLIATGQFEQVLRDISALPADGLAIFDRPLGEYLATFTQQYVGYSRYEEGAAYLATVKRVHGVKKDTQEYWTHLLARGVEEESLPADQKKRLLAKIRGL